MTDHVVLTAMQPDVLHVVNDQELLDLQRWGVVMDHYPYEPPQEVEHDGEEEPEDHGVEAPVAEEV